MLDRLEAAWKVLTSRKVVVVAKGYQFSTLDEGYCTQANGYKMAMSKVDDLLLKAQHNCNNIAEDQPNDVHIEYFNNGYKMAMSKVDDLLLKAQLTAQESEEK